MIFNDHNLEHDVTGFRILSISGREAISNELSVLATDHSDGDIYCGMRLPARDIVITYEIFASTKESYRIRRNILNAILHECEQTKVIFDDEPDKYFIGAVSDFSASEFTIHCSDPKKYSLIPRKFPSYLDGGVKKIPILNSGTVPVPISYEFTNKADNGYISITNGSDVMEFGDKVEPDEEERVMSEYAVRNWGVFNAPAYIDNDYTTQSDATSNGEWEVDNGLLQAYSYGTAGTGKKWRGVTRSYTLSKPAGMPDMKNFEADWCFYYNYSNKAQRGLAWMAILNSENAMIAGVKIIKDQASSMTASVQMWVRGLGYVKKISVNNVMSEIGKDGRHVKIAKSGDTFTFRFGGKDYSFVSPELADYEAGKELIAFYVMDAQANQVGMRLQGIWLRVDGSYMYNLPNRYSTGSVVRIDGDRQAFSLDGIYTPHDEIMGTVYFKAMPGITTVTFGFSDFCTEQPDITAEIREAWL